MKHCLPKLASVIALISLSAALPANDVSKEKQCSDSKKKDIIQKEVLFATNAMLAATDAFGNIGVIDDSLMTYHYTSSFVDRATSEPSRSKLHELYLTMSNELLGQDGESKSGLSYYCDNSDPICQTAMKVGNRTQVSEGKRQIGLYFCDLFFDDSKTIPSVDDYGKHDPPDSDQHQDIRKTDAKVGWKMDETCKKQTLAEFANTRCKSPSVVPF